MTKLRVLVADDHEVVRVGVCSLLQKDPDCEVCAEATTGRQAVALAQQLKPDVVVLDITMPELNGLEACRQMVKLVPGIQVLILSVHESEQLVREILDAGARGYVLKSDAGRELLAGLHAFRQHQLFFTSRVAQIALKAYVKQDNTPPSPAFSSVLTPREREVLQLLAEGKSNKEVADVLRISVHTLETHRARLMHKLGLHSITELVHYAIRNQIIKP